MAILILSNSRGKEIPYSKWLSSTNEELYLLGSSDYDLKNPSYKLIKGFETYESNDLVKEAEQLLEKGGFKKIIAKAEADLIRGALLREKFNIPGQSYDSALAFRNKFKMKSILATKYIPIADFCLVHKKEDAIRFAEVHGFPLIIKPVDASGSFDILKINTINELQSISNEKIKNKLLETFIYGEMYHIDGVVIYNEIKFSYPSKYITSCLAYQQNQPLKSQILEFENPLRDRLQHFVKEVIQVMPMPQHSTFHAEVFHTPNDGLVLCEIASRTGGGRVRKSLNVSFGVDIDEHWIKAQCDIPYPVNQILPNRPNILSGWILLTPIPATLKKFAEGNLPSWVIEYRQIGKEGQEYKNANKSTDCVASLMVTGNSEKQIQERLDYVEKWFYDNTQWE